MDKFRVMSKFHGHTLLDDFFGETQEIAIRKYYLKYRSNPDVKFIHVNKIKNIRKKKDVPRDMAKSIKVTSAMNEIIFMNNLNFNDTTVKLWEKYIEKEGLTV